jgi:hypothetical protein
MASFIFPSPTLFSAKTAHSIVSRAWRKVGSDLMNLSAPRSRHTLSLDLFLFVLVWLHYWAWVCARNTEPIAILMLLSFRCWLSRSGVGHECLHFWNANISEMLAFLMCQHIICKPHFWVSRMCTVMNAVKPNFEHTSFEYKNITFEHWTTVLVLRQYMKEPCRRWPYESQ